MNTITIDGVDYVPKSEAAPEGPREIVTAEAGWIFVGNVEDPGDGYLHITEAANIRKWSSGGFGALTQSRAKAEASLDEMRPIKVRIDKVLHRVPVPEGWDD